LVRQVQQELHHQDQAAKVVTQCFLPLLQVQHLLIPLPPKVVV
jgi:hypothetical protein